MVFLRVVPEKLYLPCLIIISRTLTTSRPTSELKSILAAKIPKEKEKVKKLRETHGSVVIGEITVEKLYSGLRGLKTLVCETSFVHPDEGVRLRGYSISECQKLLPKAKGGDEPLPEGVFWLLLTGEIPTESQVASISSEWAERAALPTHVAAMVKNFPSAIHPMSQFIAAIAALNYESSFANAYSKGVKKEVYWEYVYEDAMELIAKLPVISAKIYRNTYKEGKGTGIIDPKKDWSANLVQMMGFDNPGLTELMRLFLTMYSGHDGGNVSAHAVHLIGSALADPYLALAAGVSGLAGPLHGLANQEAFMYIKTIQKELGDTATDDQVKEFVRKTLNAGVVVPGFGHGVLRVTDPRYICQREFALKHLPNDPLFKIASQLFKVVPGILQDAGKVKNPWPNVDAHGGVLLQHYGLTEMKYYPVLISVSRSLGAMASLIWDRAMGLPIEHPVSITTEYLMKKLKVAS